MRLPFRVKWAVSALVAVAAAGSVSSDADAKQIHALLSEGGNWNVNSWNDCSGGSGRRVSADSHALNGATLICSARATVAGNWVAGTGNCTGATTHRGYVRRNFLVDCSTPVTSTWTTQVQCTTPSITTKLTGAADSTCAPHSFRAFAQGTL